MKIYLASSWRNTRQADVLAALRGAGHEVYDFKNPVPGDNGFSWKWCDPRPPSEWAVEDYLRVLEHPVAQRGFGYDMGALEWSDACVLVLPCGRSAHMEFGWAVGAGKRGIVLCEKLDEPELMYLMAGRAPRSVIVSAVDALLVELAALSASPRKAPQEGLEPRDVAAYLVDRADQYGDSSASVALTTVAKEVMRGEVAAAVAHGEFDDALYERVDQRKPPPSSPEEQLSGKELK